MDIKELMVACDGQDDHGMPKSSVVIINEFWYQDGRKDSVDEIVLESPTVKIFSGDGFTQLDLDFGSKHNVDLSLTNDMLERFRQVQNSIGDDAERMPVTTVVILPSNYEGQYYLACINPMWVGLTANNPMDELSVIRMTFPEDSVLMYENEEFEPDIDEDEEDE